MGWVISLVEWGPPERARSWLGLGVNIEDVVIDERVTRLGQRGDGRFQQGRRRG